MIEGFQRGRSEREGKRNFFKKRMEDIKNGVSRDVGQGAGREDEKKVEVKISC